MSSQEEIPGEQASENDVAYSIPVLEVLSKGNASENSATVTHQGIHEACTKISSICNLDSEKWSILMELQNKLLSTLIEVIRTPITCNNLRLPAFNPRAKDMDPWTWLTTADTCVTGDHQSGTPLIMALTRALQSDASSWFTSISNPGLTWYDFKKLFKAKYIESNKSSMTPASYLITFNDRKPENNKCLTSYALSLASSLISKWSYLTKEEIAIATVLSHVSKFDSRISKLARTTEINTFTKMSTELSELCRRKKRASNEDCGSSASKRARLSRPDNSKCIICGENGHRSPYCRSPLALQIQEERDRLMVPDTDQKSKKCNDISCYICKDKGHSDNDCPKRCKKMRKEKKTSKADKPQDSAAGVSVAGAADAVASDTGASDAGAADAGAADAVASDAGTADTVASDAGASTAEAPAAGATEARASAARVSAQGSSPTGASTTGTSDAGASAAGVSAVETTDAGASAIGVSAAGAAEAGVSAVGASTAGAFDAGVSATGASNAGTSDAGTSDAGTSDAGTSAAGVAAIGESTVGAPTAETSTAVASTAGASAAGVSAAEASDEGASAAGVSAAGLSAAEASDGGASATGVSAAGVAEAGTSGAGASAEGTSPDGASAAGAVAAGVLATGSSDAGVSAAGTTDAGVPAAGGGDHALAGDDVINMD